MLMMFFLLFLLLFFLPLLRPPRPRWFFLPGDSSYHYYVHQGRGDLCLSVSLSVNWSIETWRYECAYESAELCSSWWWCGFWISFPLPSPLWNLEHLLAHSYWPILTTLGEMTYANQVMNPQHLFQCTKRGAEYNNNNNNNNNNSGFVSPFRSEDRGIWWRRAKYECSFITAWCDA